MYARVHPRSAQEHAQTIGHTHTHTHTHTNTHTNTACDSIANSEGPVFCTSSGTSEGYFDGGFQCLANFSYTPATIARPAATCDRMHQIPDSSLSLVMAAPTNPSVGRNA